MKKLGRGLQGHTAYQISKLNPFQFQKRRILKMGFFVPTFQLVIPGARPVLTPGESYEKFLVEVHKEMLCTKYESSRPSSFKEKEF